MSRVLVTMTSSAAGPRVQVSGCPRCRRPMQLDNAGLIDEDGEYVDLGMVTFAQQLHLGQCRG